MSWQDEFGPVYTPEEVEEMHRGIGRRMRGLVKMAEDLDENDPDQLADKAWLIGTAEDVTAWFDMQDAALRREASTPATEHQDSSREDDQT